MKRIYLLSLTAALSISGSVMAQSPAPKPTVAPAKSIPAPSPAASASPAAVTATPAPQTVVVIEREKAPEEPKSSLIGGWIGLAILAVGGVFGARYLKSRNLTVTGAFKQLGVELPTEAGPSGASAPLKPVPTPLPPLPSLSDLPSAGAAPAGVALSGGAAAPAAPPLPPPTGQPKLIGLRGPVAGKTIPLFDVLTVGRDPENNVALDGDTTVSRKHAIFLSGPGGWELADSGSSNGTFVNGQKLAAAQVLTHGDEIAIGTARLRYEA